MKHSAIKQSAEVEKRRERLIEICAALPEVSAVVQGLAQEHRAFQVRKKTFAYYLFDHHADGRIALWCKAAPGEQGRLVEEEPRRFFVPPYLGPRGWLGVRLDLASAGWPQVQYLVTTAYRLTAPRALMRLLE